MKVLIGVDGSIDSREAVTQAAALIDPSKDTVVFYYSPIGIRLPGARAGQENLVEDARAAMAKVVFDHARSVLPNQFHAGLRTMVGTRHPSTGLLAAADDVHADLIVVGASGAAGFQRILLGSVSRSVVHASKVPVLVARRRGSTHETGLTVLWAFAREHAESVTRYLNQLSWPPETRSHVLTVVSSQFAAEIPADLAEAEISAEIRAWGDQWSRAYEAEKQEARDALSSLCTKLDGSFAKAECHVAEGHPVDQILRRITEKNVDLVILGARAGGAFARLFLGSTSDAVLNQATCSVLIVRESARP